MIRNALKSIRKFGMGYCDLPTTMWNISVLLRMLTINIDSRNKNPIHIFAYIWTVIILVCYVYTFDISMGWFVFWRARETGDYLGAVCVFSAQVASEIGTFKMFYIYFQSRTLTKTVEEYLASDAAVIPGSRFSKNILTTMRKVKRRAILFWSTLMINSVFYTVKPILRPGRHFMDDWFILYGLEPILKSPNYEIAYLIVMGAAFCCCYTAASVSGFLIIVAGYSEAQTRGLSEEIRSLRSDAEEYYLKYSANMNTKRAGTNCNEEDNKKNILNKYIEQRLHNIVNIHVTNKKLIRQIEEVFRGATITEFVLLGIGLVCDLLGGLENTYSAVPFAFVQVMMDCITGQRLLDASIQFENAVYDCKWEDFDCDNMKTVLLILQHSQRSLTLSAGGIVSLNFESLMSIVRMIYSAYTALRSTMDFK